MPGMQEPQHYDVIIVGGGMVGLAMALALIPTGLRLALLDPQPLPPPPESLRKSLSQPEFDPRVSALTPASQALLEALGVWQTLAGLRLCPYTDMQVWDADGTGSIHFAAAELHQPCLGYIIENSCVSAVLAAAVQASGKVQIVRDSLANYSAQSGRQFATLTSGTELTCKLLIGADGGNSHVRTLAGIATKEWDTGHRALVTTVKTAQNHRHTAWQRFMQTGPLAFLPLHLPGDAAQQ